MLTFIGKHKGIWYEKPGFNSNPVCSPSGILLDRTCLMAAMILLYATRTAINGKRSNE